MAAVVKKSTGYQLLRLDPATGDLMVDAAPNAAKPVHDDPTMTLCICNRDDLDLWIGCDNPKCPVEWYHCECVGLDEPPAGTWLCPQCAPAKTSKSTKPSKRSKSHKRVLSFSSLVLNSPTATQASKRERSTNRKERKGVAHGKVSAAPRKGVTVKKEKPKPKWRGWVEVEDDEDEGLEAGAGKNKMMEVATERGRSMGRAGRLSAKLS